MNEQNENAVPPQEGATSAEQAGASATTPALFDRLVHEMDDIRHGAGLSMAEMLRQDFEQFYVETFGQVCGNLFTVEDLQRTRTEDGYTHAHPNDNWKTYCKAHTLSFTAPDGFFEEHIQRQQEELLQSTRELVNNATAAVMGIAGVTRIDITEQALADVEAKYSVEMTPHEDGKGYTLELIPKQ